VNNNLHTKSTQQINQQDSVKGILPAAHFSVDFFAFTAVFAHKNLACGTFFILTKKSCLWAI